MATLTQADGRRECERESSDRDRAVDRDREAVNRSIDVIRRQLRKVRSVLEVEAPDKGRKDLEEDTDRQRVERDWDVHRASSDGQQEER